MREMGVRSHVVRCLLSQDVVYYLQGVRRCVCDLGYLFLPKFLCCAVWCSFSAILMCSCDDLLKESDDLFWWKTLNHVSQTKS